MRGGGGSGGLLLWLSAVLIHPPPPALAGLPTGVSTDMGGTHVVQPLGPTGLPSSGFFGSSSAQHLSTLWGYNCKGCWFGGAGVTLWRQPRACSSPKPMVHCHWGPTSRRGIKPVPKGTGVSENPTGNLFFVTSRLC